MRIAKRTLFNRLYQSHRIGRRVLPRKQNKIDLGFKMPLFRKSNRSKSNQILARFTLLRIRIKRNNYKPSKSFMLKKCYDI